MTTEASKKTFNRIRKLLTKAEGTTNEHERETFMAAARGLMAKYGIDQARLGYLSSGREKPQLREVACPDPYSKEQTVLLHNVAKALRCRSVTMRVPRSKDATVELVGFAYDLDRLELLYPSLLLQMLGGMAQQRIPQGESKTVYLRSWAFGFIVEATAKLEAAEKHAADEQAAQDKPGEASTALVLLKNDEVVDTLFAKLYPKLRQARQVKVNNDAWHSGAEAGRRADVGGARLDTTPKASIR
ncbi:DUF2786 domain-containing protein [Nonomuraea sp. NPDC049758]|uniref:DUF2786 domain-containing protein n=1 Tax=Nonomuraea sp. NPDC049758 TaxID=3154360 RepID=UPI003443A106